MITTNVHEVISVSVEDKLHATFVTKDINIKMANGETYRVTLFSKEKLEIKDGNA